MIAYDKTKPILFLGIMTLEDVPFYCITARFLEYTSQLTGEYTIPARTKEIKMPFSSVHFPNDWNSGGIMFNINFTSRSEVKLRQTTNYYSISESSLDTLRLDYNIDL